MLCSLDRRRLSETLRTDGRATAAVTAAREERAGAEEVAAVAGECGGAMVDGACDRGRRKAGAYPLFGAGAVVVDKRGSGGASGKGTSHPDRSKREREREREERENEAAEEDRRRIVDDCD